MMRDKMRVRMRDRTARALLVALVVAACGLLGPLSPGAAAAESPPARDRRAHAGNYEPGHWSRDSAFLLPRGRLEVGLFAPLRYGLTPRVELSAHPLWMFVVPNVSARIAWFGGGGEASRDATGHGTTSGWQLATRHGLDYPTLLLRLVAREGTGGLLPANTRVPHIFALHNDVVASRRLGAHHVVTWSVGVTVAPRLGEADMVTIDLPLVYPRTAAYHTAATGRAGLDLAGRLNGAFVYAIDADLFVLPGLDGRYAFEHATTIGWQPSARVALRAGYKMTCGGYPFGDQLHILPLVDLLLAFE